MATPALGESDHDIAPPTTRQLDGIDKQHADALIAQLVTAQDALRAGKFETFELLAGAPASYDESTIPPRTAFLRTHFDQVWEIRRLTSTPGSDDPRRTYALAYAPNGLGKAYWNIVVNLGFSGDLIAVTMRYQAPAPF